MSKNYVKDFYAVLIQSEELKRLLWYPPEDLATNTPPPLSADLPNISDDEELNWKCIEDRIMLNSKSDDLVDSEKCRIYLYLGTRRPSNRVFSEQEIIIDVLWHEKFEEDFRFDSITKTLGKLLVDQRITGVGRVRYSDGRPINAPKNYQGYRHVYEFGSQNK